MLEALRNMHCSLPWRAWISSQTPSLHIQAYEFTGLPACSSLRPFCSPAWALTKFVALSSFSENFRTSLHLSLLPRTYLAVPKVAALMQDAQIRY